MAAGASLVTAAANGVAAVITHWGLVDAGGTELSGGGYARQAGQATNASGTARPPADLVFTVGAGAVVGGWRGFSALTAGTNHGGGNITPNETYGSTGTFTLLAASTGYPVTAP